ncbi:hypothetical protein KX928_09500 [Roseobacter sp. YSTF-M11]|uniref:EF-hand domain-containing protein n=1 Tax=Roseobacter insulae TaxID=2859783 RepID=A0A9X1FUM1_9RHOB|nr:hypothetical protein [Roseobacter insulae]
MKMITKPTIALIAVLSASAAMAQLAADANGDGVLTIDEVQAVYPDITAETFSTMDLNADGALDEAEVQSAQEAGLMPA